MNCSLSRGAAALLALALAACHDSTSPGDPAEPAAATAAGAQLSTNGATRLTPTGKGIGTLAIPVASRDRYKIEYHPSWALMRATSNLYVIWYGNWRSDTATISIVTDLLTSLGGSQYFNITSLYKDSNGVGPSGGLVYGGAVADEFSRGASLSDQDIRDVVAAHQENGGLPHDPRGIYLVLASPEVTATSGFATEYCAFHAASEMWGSWIKYAFIGAPARAPASCAPQMTGPNDNYAADAMASLIAAELANTVVDPLLSMWYDRLGFEPADKCAWSYGTTYTTANGARANVRLGRRDYLLQQLWVPKNGGYCALSLPPGA